MRTVLPSLVLLLVLTAAAPAAAEAPLGLRVPPAFEVTEFAGSTLANDIFSMALDPQGRVVVSGPGYIRTLVDDDGDGRADRAIDLTPGPREGAQGLLWEGSTLWFMADGGLRRYRIGPDSRAVGPSELVLALKTGGEHESHAIRRGPDGWLYLLCGNVAGVDASYAPTAASPIRQPVGGCVLRLSPDSKTPEVVADGFRNPYDMDFNAAGDLFTFDSDNERCVSLPWYESTRFYQVIPGGHYGWQAPQHGQWWRWPPYFSDVVAPLASLGRGSPTGVVCYRHGQFPEHYRGGIFLLDWTFGRVYFLTLQRSGATYRCQKEIFLEAVGDNGFAPTAAVVSPRTGDLYIAIGGRGTRGAVYRIRSPQGFRSLDPEAAAGLQVRPCSLDWQPDSQEALIRKATTGDPAERLRALAAIRRFRPHFQGSQVRQVILANWGHPERALRQAAADLIASLPPEERQVLAGQPQTALEETTCGLGTYATDPGRVLTRAGDLLAAGGTGAEARLASVRLIQLALGGLMSPACKDTAWEGYSPRRPLPPSGVSPEALDRAVQVLRAVFPTGQADLDREVSRTLAVVEDDDPATLTKMAGRLTSSSDPVEDVHYLIVLARLRGHRPAPVTRQVADALLALDQKLDQRHLNRDRNWPLRVAEAHAELARKDPALNAALLAAADFGRPDQVLFTRCPGFDRRRAAGIFLAHAVQDEEYPWSPDLVGLVAGLPAEQALPVLRGLWGRGGLEESLLPVLARHPQEADRDKFLEGLASPQSATVSLCLEALDKLPAPDDGAPLLAVLHAWQRLPDTPERNPLHERFGRYLRRLTGRGQAKDDKRAWMEWFSRTHPDLAGRLGGADGVDVGAWNKRLAALDWSAGDGGRGRLVFTRAACASCHSGAQALGPDLHGVTGRFSRADLFTAILQPSKDISPRYRATVVETADGKLYQGMIVYEAVDSLILQTGPAATVRVVNQQITSRRVSDVSMMPAGLLDKLSDGDIIDLYAYLKSLGDSAGREGKRSPARAGPDSKAPG